jgi:acyl-homoserine-lactone acylase
MTITGSAARNWPALALALMTAACATTGAPAARPASPGELAALSQQVEIRRTAHGVPHILAESLRAAAFALAYVQIEDHGTGIIEGMNAARGRSALVEGISRIDADAVARLRHERARAAFDSLEQDTREVYHGFAAGMNHYIRVHAGRIPAWIRADFTAHDVLARDIAWPSQAVMNRFRQRLLEDTANRRLLRAGAADGTPVRYVVTEQDAENVGSNAWALAPERTASGNAILLRNPHLSWTAGYYEAHIRVPGQLDFYGDFRIGGPFTIIGGFNADLGFSTTNNAARNHEFYALDVDPSRAGNYLLDGASVPLERDVVTVEFRDSTGRTRRDARTSWTTRIGPVVHRDARYVYVLRSAGAGDFRAGEQWLEMMRAASLDEWKDAMRIGARTTSNLTYADRAGNILYVWMSGAPLLPHSPGGDTLAIHATTLADVWTRRMPFDSLPQLLNPPGGYLHNENDSPHYANLNAIMTHSFRFPVEVPRLRLRSQHALELLHNDRVFTLEEVVAAKHSMRMLLADRVKEDLLAGLDTARGRPRADGALSRTGADTAADDEITRAAALLAQWDNTAAAESRGGVLFETWWNRYRELMGGEDLYAFEWNEREPVTTPRGIADVPRAVDAFEWAVAETMRRFGSWDVAWGEVHRVRRGAVDVPVGGCGGALGCFRVLNFTTAADGRRVVDGGDGWVIAVEFGAVPRAYSVLAYGQSPDPSSPYHDDQAAMFAANGMKTVLWTEPDIARGATRRYRPGQEVH